MQQMPRRFPRSIKVSLKDLPDCATPLQTSGRQNGVRSYDVVVSPRALLSWLAAGVALPEDTDSPGEIKAGVETVEDTKTKAKSKNSRARRLSYVANAEGVGPQV